MPVDHGRRLADSLSDAPARRRLQRPAISRSSEGMTIHPQDGGGYDRCTAIRPRRHTGADSHP
jgi:hypothetical protein